MAGENRRIGFALPEQSKPRKDSFNTKAHKLDEWVAQLPMGNVGETARQVFSALYETNRLQIGWKDRYRLLETLRPSVAYVGQALHKRFTGLTFPLPPKTQRIANLTTELYNEMALGYKAAIEDMLARSFLFRNKRALTVMLHRTLRYLNRVMLTTYQVYAPQPKNTWSDLHKLYRYAENNKLQQIAVTDKEQSILPKTSIATAYKQALLLALATPYRLRQGEVSVVYSALELWSHLAQVQPYSPAANRDAAMFIVQLSSNEEPSHLAFSHFNCDDGMCRLIEMERLTTTVHDELNLISKGTKTELKERLGNALTVDLLHRLSVTWGIPPKRGFYRNTKSAKVEIVVGLTALHRALGLVTALRSLSTTHTTTTGPEDLFSKTSSFSSRTISSVNDKKDDVWQLYKPQTTKQPSAQIQTGPKTTPLEMQTWEVRDESSGGFRIARSGTDTLGVQVGDLIGVRPLTDTHDAHWIIAVVRWIRQNSANELEMGLQNLAHRSQPAAARMHHGSARSGEYQRIIGLPEIKEPPQAQSILVPALIFTVGSTLEVNFDGQVHTVILTNMLENTGAFSQFTFENVGLRQGTPETASTDKSSELPSDFNSLWSEL